MYKKDRLRRSMMFVPGNNPGMIRDAHIYGADSIMFDLEDSVSYAEKDAARLLVYNAIKTLNFGSKEIVVRINDLSSGLGVEDLEAVVRAGVQVVRLPKTDSAQDVIDCEREIERIEREAGIPVGTTGMMAAIESANGVLNAADMMLHNYGPDAYSGSVNIEIDHSKTVGEVYQFIHKLQLDIMHKYDVTMVFGIYAVDDDHEVTKQLRKTIGTFVKKTDGVKSFHAIYLDPDSDLLYCDLIVEYSLRDWEALEKDFKDYMAAYYPDKEVVLTIETEFV